MMSRAKNSNKGVSLVALGGLGEIGMNCLALEADGRLLVIDCGVMFPQDGLGIDLIHPGFDHLANRRNDIEAVVLTHAHEDHMAGVPFLLREIDVPIYAGSYSLGLLSERCKDLDPELKLQSKRLEPGGRVELGPFRVNTFPMPHSVIENTGVAIETDGLKILHTGDFKLGLGGPEQGCDTIARLEAAAGGDVDLMLADSTGSEDDEPAGEESDVESTIEKLVLECQGRVFVAIFSSNVDRLKSLIDVSLRCDRRISFCGRSVATHHRIASEIGAVSLPRGLFTPIDEAADLPRHKSLVVVSGTQGERNSALTRLAYGNHQAIGIKKGDLVILSSRFIPGNEIAIARVIDQLHRLGARVVHRHTMKGVHVSGHGSRPEILKAIRAVNPRCFVPVHGTYRHLVAAAELAREAGVKRVAVASDGDIVRLERDRLAVEPGPTPPRRVFIDGGSGLTDDEIKDRRTLGSKGVLAVHFGADDQGRISGDIEVAARGVVRESESQELKDSVVSETKLLIDGLAPDERKDKERCGQTLRSSLRRHVNKLFSREPYVIVSILPARGKASRKPRD